MHKNTVFFVVLVALVFVTGCRGGHDDGYGQGTVYEEDYWPYLMDFQMVDSFGLSTENDLLLTPELDPFVDDGVFDVSWEVDAVRDYIVEYRLNTVPSVEGSLLIDAELCGQGLPCDQFGWQLCQYNADYSMSCDVANPAYADLNSTFDPLFFGDWVGSTPQALYFILEVCDTESLYCEYLDRRILVY